jgi:hypothetical protein
MGFGTWSFKNVYRAESKVMICMEDIAHIRKMSSYTI